MAEKKEVVTFDSEEKLLAGNPYQKKMKPFAVVKDGKTIYLWARNPKAALYAIHRDAVRAVSRTISSTDEIVSTFATLSDEERNAVLSKLTGFKAPTKKVEHAKK